MNRVEKKLIQDACIQAVSFKPFFLYFHLSAFQFAILWKNEPVNNTTLVEIKSNINTNHTGLQYDILSTSNGSFKFDNQYF